MRRWILVLGITASMVMGLSGGAAAGPEQTVVIIGTTPLYLSKGAAPGRSALAPVQSVRLAEGEAIDYYDERTENEWLKIRTWEGDRWIRDGDDVLYGTYTEESRPLTLLGTAKLYDLPDVRTDTGQALSPQKLNSSASATYGPKYVVNAMSAAGKSGVWYRVDTTWLGPKWILNPALMEDVREEPADYKVKLMGSERAYLVPYNGEGEGEPVGAGEAQVKGIWQEANFPNHIDRWYRVQLPQGERWIQTLDAELEKID
ncbi:MULTISPECIES: hypothetical protein [Paenibacillus]|uniref:hypothetical protein n=1 Tax=Paenibacillus TaxID=44249 RepID=UPI0022B86938|nr:hypothetical protein [Paenibacillus caseinilyticus]MCZ8522685.1 hypothetical protein [Paenibacillus caseinilyticus]